MDLLAVRVANRFQIRTAVSQAWPKVRVASVPELTPEIVVAFVEPFYAHQTKVAFFGNVVKKVTQLLDMFRKAPRLWDQLKGFLGLPKDFDGLSLLERGKILASTFKAFAASGAHALKDVLLKAKDHFPLSMFFVAKNKMPGLTDLLEKLVKKVPWMAKALAGVSKGIGRVDDWFNKYLPNLKRPILAAIFIWVWFSVAELTWDLAGMFKGFTGGISLGELFGSLPEAGIGLIASAFGLGYGALPVALIARILWLVANHFLEWVPGKGFKVRWDRLGVEEPSEIVPA